MQLGRGLVEQENTTGEHDHVFARHAKVIHVKQRCGQLHDVSHRSQHDDAYHHSQRQANNAGFVAVLRLDLVRQNRHKHQIVYAQHHFQNQQG